jgi:N,N'-diacetyllegionaminate synthase
MLIAEFCQNHNGDISILREMVVAAADSGATHAKIQTIYAEDLSYRARFEEFSPHGGDQISARLSRPFGPEFTRLKSLELSSREHEQFVVECERRNLIPVTTAFNLTRIPLIRDAGFEIVKIASYDCASTPLIEAAIENFDTVIISTGASFDDEIAGTAAVVRSRNADVYFLHCVTIYPTPLSEMHLSRIHFLREFTPKVGLSSHPHATELGVEADLIALAMGAEVIERHFTILDRDATRDGKVSVTPDELRQIRDFMDLSIDERRQKVDLTDDRSKIAMGMMDRSLSESELSNRDYYRGRFINRTQLGPRTNWAEDVRRLTGI